MGTLLQKIKNLYHGVKAVLAGAYFSFPSRYLTVIGVTGTNGKTTTVQMISRILEEAGRKTAVSSTINFKIGEKEWVNKTKFTTLSSWKVQRFIRQAVEDGCRYLILEVSSHALDQNRVWGVDFDVAVITNVTREHLDYHRTMKFYRQAKQKLFSRLRNNFRISKLGNIFLFRKSLKNKKVAVVNLDMEQPEDFLQFKADKKYGYRIETVPEKQEPEKQEKVDVKNYPKELEVITANALKLNSRGVKFQVKGTEFELQLIGKTNIENALAAICVGLSQGIDLKVMREALASIKKVPGRMDFVENKRGLKIIIDYALTPDSMEKLGRLLEDIKSDRQNRVFWVFGSCGERDRGKRPIMGAIAARYADYVIVTNEDPYNEDPQRIINEVFAGVVKSDNKVDGKGTKKIEGENAWRISNRREAIKKALLMARENDIILVTGKGAEESMAIGKRRIAWNDKKVIEKLLKEKDLRLTGDN